MKTRLKNFWALTLLALLMTCNNLPTFAAEQLPVAVSPAPAIAQAGMSVAPVQAPVADPAPVAVPAPVVAQAPVDTNGGAIAAEQLLERKRSRIGWRQQKRLGLTLKNVRRVRQELIDSGFMTKDTPRSTQAAIILRAVQAENSQAFEAEKKLLEAQGDTDWDAFFQSLIQFIEALIPLIELIITLFASLGFVPLAVGFLVAGHLLDKLEIFVDRHRSQFPT